MKTLKEKILSINFDHLRESQHEWRSYLATKYGFSDHDISNFDRFKPIIEVNQLDGEAIAATLHEEKELFIQNQGFWNYDIFFRNNGDLQHLKFSLNEYLDSIQRGKVIDWFPQLPKKEDIEIGTYTETPFKADRFCYWLKLDSEIETPNHQTILLTNLTLPQLELYFNSLLKSIDALSCKKR